jgi:hypothetical protein
LGAGVLFVIGESFVYRTDFAGILKQAKGGGIAMAGKSNKGEDLLQYVTEKLVVYASTPRQERRETRSHRPLKEPWSVRWFGMLPLSLKIWRNTHRK